MAFKRSAVRSRLSPPNSNRKVGVFLFSESLSDKQTTAVRSRLSPPRPTERLVFFFTLRVFQANKQQRFDPAYLHQTPTERLVFFVLNVGAIIDRPPKNYVFRVSRRKISRFSPCGDRFCFGKICGRPLVAPTPVLASAGLLLFCSSPFLCERGDVGPGRGRSLLSSLLPQNPTEKAGKYETFRELYQL